MADSPVFHIRCLLEGVSPPVWRSLQVPGWLTFGQLESLIRTAFGWSQEGSASSRFDLAGRTLVADSPDPDASKNGWKLRDWFAPGFRFMLETGAWQVAIQAVGASPSDPGQPAARCIGGERAAPPEEVDGPAAYARMLKHPKQRGLWNPERFDLSAVNVALETAVVPMKTVRTPKRPFPPVSPPEGPGFFLKENDVQFDLHAYYQELETAYWQEPCPETLAQALSQLQRDELLGLCMVYGLPVEPVFRRVQLEVLLKQHLPEAIRLQVPMLDDRQYGLLRQVVESPEGCMRFARADMLFSPYELYYFRDRLLLFPRLQGQNADLYMLPEVRDALRLDAMQSLSRTQLQNANRRRILCGLFQYYGVMTLDDLQQVLSELLGEAVDMDTLIVDIQELQDFHDAVSIGDVLVMHTALDPDAAGELWQRQQGFGDVPYRKPTLETLDLAGDWMFVEATHEAEILISFLESRYGMNTGAAEGVAWELMHRFRWGETLGKALAMAHTALGHPDAAAEQRFSELVAQLWLHAPAWCYKGWSPADMQGFALSVAGTEPSALLPSEDFRLASQLMQESGRSTSFDGKEGKGQLPARHGIKRAGRVLRFPQTPPPEA